MLIAGDEFGPLGGLPGSDSFLLVPEAARAAVISVGAEPHGVPADVIALGGGPVRFLDVLADQLERRRRWDVPELDGDPAGRWRSTVSTHGSSACTNRCSRWPTAGSDGAAPLLDDPSLAPAVLLSGVYAGAGRPRPSSRAPGLDAARARRWRRAAR